MDDDRVLRAQPASKTGRWRVAIAVVLGVIVCGLFVARAACISQGYEWFWLPSFINVEPDYWGCVNTDE